MVHGDDPAKAYPQTDELGLTQYTYRPDIDAVTQSNNLYVYCANNPVWYCDTAGNVFETVFDIVSLGVSIAEAIDNTKNTEAWVSVFADTVDLIPFVTGVGEVTRAVRIADAVGDAADTIHDTQKTVEIITDSTKKTDFYVTPEGVSFPASKTEFEHNLSKMENKNGKYVSYDKEQPIRVRYNEIHADKQDFTGVKNPDHTVPHFHFEKRENGASGKWKKVFTGRMEMLL